MYFVNHGVCSARVQGAEVANMEHGDFFGEIALTLSCTRTADVYAQGTVELFEFARKDFKTIVAKYPYLLQKLKQTARARVRNAVAPRAAIVDSNDDAMQQQVYAGGAVSHQDGYDDKAVQPSTLLMLRSLFNLGSGETAEDGMLIKVSALAWADIVASMTRVRVEKDEIVMSRQAPPGGLYIVEDGQVELLTHGVAVETMSAGDFFGEVAVLLMDDADFTMIATSESHLLFLSAEALSSIMGDYTLVARNLHHLASARAEKYFTT